MSRKRWGPKAIALWSGGICILVFLGIVCAGKEKILNEYYRQALMWSSQEAQWDFAEELLKKGPPVKNIAETWYLQKLRTGNAQEQRRAAERLGSSGSLVGLKYLFHEVPLLGCNSSDDGGTNIRTYEILAGTFIRNIGQSEQAGTAVAALPELLDRNSTLVENALKVLSTSDLMPEVFRPFVVDSLAMTDSACSRLAAELLARQAVLKSSGASRCHRPEVTWQEDWWRVRFMIALDYDAKGKPVFGPGSDCTVRIDKTGRVLRIDWGY